MHCNSSCAMYGVLDTPPLARRGRALGKRAPPKMAHAYGKHRAVKVNVAQQHRTVVLIQKSMALQGLSTSEDVVGTSSTRTCKT